MVGLQGSTVTEFCSVHKLKGTSCSGEHKQPGVYFNIFNGNWVGLLQSMFVLSASGCSHQACVYSSTSSDSSVAAG